MVKLIILIEINVSERVFIIVFYYHIPVHYIGLLQLIQIYVPSVVYVY